MFIYTFRNCSRFRSGVAERRASSNQVLIGIRKSHPPKYSDLFTPSHDCVTHKLQLVIHTDDLYRFLAHLLDPVLPSHAQLYRHVLQMSCDLIGWSIQAQIANHPDVNWRDVQMLLWTNHMPVRKSCLRVPTENFYSTLTCKHGKVLRFWGCTIRLTFSISETRCSHSFYV